MSISYLKIYVIIILSKGVDDDLRSILAHNIKNARAVLRISQSGLAEDADISLSSVIDIERRRTWVSDRTLANLAKALHTEAYQLLKPAGREVETADNENSPLEQIMRFIDDKKLELRKISDESIEDLRRKILKLYDSQ
jgi:transcriptional regulator with XRE-family HTH domain